MQINVVRHLAAGMVLQVKFDSVALAHTDKVPRHGTAECPEGIVHPF